MGEASVVHPLAALPPRSRGEGGLSGFEERGERGEEIISGSCFPTELLASV